MSLPEITQRNFTAGLLTDTIGESTAATGVTIDGVLLKDGAITAALTATSLDLDGVLDQDAALTAAGDGQNVAVTINHASAAAEGIDVAIAQLTTSRTSGTVSAVKAKTTSLAGDSGGVYNGLEIVATDGGGSATHNAILVGAGHDVLLDLQAAATGQSDIVVGDNLASALEIRNGANQVAVVKTTTGDVALDVKQVLTTTDGVAGGIARRVGGRHSAISAAGSSLTGTTSETVLASASLASGQLRIGSELRVRFKARVTADNGATTLTARLRLGPTTLTGTALIASSAVDTSSGFIFAGEFQVTCRAAPSASSECVGSGWFCQPGAAGGAMVTANINATNFATNGTLLLEMTGEWSAGDANAVQAEEFSVEIIG